MRGRDARAAGQCRHAGFASGDRVQPMGVIPVRVAGPVVRQSCGRLCPVGAKTPRKRRDLAEPSVTSCDRSGYFADRHGKLRGRFDAVNRAGDRRSQ